MRPITISFVLSLQPCYTRDELEAVAGGRQSMTPLQVCDADAPAADILWLLLREEFIPSQDLHEFACACAERALQREREAGREPDARSWRAVEVKRQWLVGEVSVGKVTAAEAPAWSALMAIDDGDDGDFAWGVRGPRGRSARAAAASALAAVGWSCGGARRAADWAASGVAQGAGRDAERAWQLASIRRILVGMQ